LDTLVFPITQFGFEANFDRGHCWASIQPQASRDNPGQNLAPSKVRSLIGAAGGDALRDRLDAHPINKLQFTNSGKTVPADTLAQTEGMTSLLGRSSAGNYVLGNVLGS
jgi:hypothetical protein